MIQRFVVLVAAALGLGTAALAAAAPTPVPSPSATPVSVPTLSPNSHLDPYAKAAIDMLGGVIRQQIQNSANSTSGEVSYFKRFDMQLQTGRNAYRVIHLHQGTVINPRGQSVTVGQRVDVSGTPQQDGSLDANVITIQQ